MPIKVKRSYLLVLFLILVGAAFLFFSRRTPANVQSQGKESGLYEVVPTSLKSVLALSGTVDAEEKATLQFQISGKLIWVGVKEGDSVTQGQTIARLDDRDVRTALDKKAEDFLTKRWEHDQLRDTYKDRYTGTGNTYLTDEITRIMELSQFGLDKAVIDYELARLNMDLCHLDSPINGTVVHIDQPYAGINITPATARFEIVNPATIYLKMLVDQQDIVKLESGNTAKIVFDSFPDTVYEGRLYYMAYAPESVSENAYVVKVTIPGNVTEKLRLGMGAEVSIVTDKKTNVLAIPFTAISESGKKTYVTVVKNNRRIQREVVLGIESDDLVEVKKGLHPGEVVVY